MNFLQSVSFNPKKSPDQRKTFNQDLKRNSLPELTSFKRITLNGLKSTDFNELKPVDFCFDDGKFIIKEGCIFTSKEDVPINTIIIYEITSPLPDFSILPGKTEIIGTGMYI